MKEVTAVAQSGIDVGTGSRKRRRLVRGGLSVGMLALALATGFTAAGVVDGDGEEPTDLCTAGAGPADSSRPAVYPFNSC